jgi:hypothetical protein
MKSIFLLFYQKFFILERRALAFSSCAIKIIIIRRAFAFSCCDIKNFSMFHESAHIFLLRYQNYHCLNAVADSAMKVGG